MLLLCSAISSQLLIISGLWFSSEHRIGPLLFNVKFLHLRVCTISLRSVLSLKERERERERTLENLQTFRSWELFVNLNLLISWKNVWRGKTLHGRFGVERGKIDFTEKLLSVVTRTCLSLKREAENVILLKGFQWCNPLFKTQNQGPLG